MKQTWKQISSLILSVCMVLTMLPMMTFAHIEENVSDDPPEFSGEIIDFVDLDADVATQTVEAGTTEDELKLPETLTAIIITEAVITFDVSSDENATDDDSLEPKTTEPEEIQTAVYLSGWTSNPTYESDIAIDYTFTPTLDLPDGLILAAGVSIPTITVTVTESAEPMAHGIISPMSIGTITGTMDIDGKTVSDLTKDAGNLTENGWSWDSSNATLTLDNSYKGEPISINCQNTDIINLAYTGDVSITSNDTSTIYCKGSLNITGNDTLTLNSTSINSLYCAIEIIGTLSIGGSADVNATCAGSGTTPAAVVIYANQGITVSDSAHVTVTAKGVEASGIWVEQGDITISTTGTVTANGNVTGGALDLQNGRKLNMSAGTLALSGNPLSGTQFAELNITGGSITIDDSPVYRALLTLSGVNTETKVAVSAPPSGYGISSKYTNGNGQLCFLLPAGSQTVTLTADGIVYTVTGTVATDNTTELAMTGVNETPGNITINGDIADNFSCLTGNAKSTNGRFDYLNPSTYGDSINNTLTINSGNFTGSPMWFYGAYTDVKNEDSVGNQVIVNGGSFQGDNQSIYGGESRNYVGGKVHSRNNSVTINDFLGSIASVYGSGGSSSGDAIGNKVIINGGSGTIGTICGGFALDHASGNEVVIKADNITVNRDISGGITSLETATNNSVTISGNADLSGAALRGGSASFGGDAFTGNTLNLLVSNQEVNSLANFENYNFQLPADITNGEPMLTVTNGNGEGPVDIGNANIGISIATTLSLSQGNKIVLIDSISKGLSGTPNNNTITASGYTFIISVENNQLVATVTGAPISSSYNVIFINGNSVHATKAVVYPSTTIDALPANPTNGSYTFSGWYTGTNGRGTRFYSSTPVISNMTVYAYWTGGGSGGSGGSTTSPTKPTPEKKTDQPVTVSAPVTATVGTDGTASAIVSDKTITEAITKAQGKNPTEISIKLNVTMPKGAASLTALLTKNSLKSLINADVTSLELIGTPVSLEFDLDALKEIRSQSDGDISINISPAAGLSDEAKALIGNRPVYNITISTTGNGEIKDITDLGNGTATLYIPYVPIQNEVESYLFGVYVDNNGNASRIKDSAYDADMGGIILPTWHFSIYGVGYTAPSAKFTDVGTHWGKESIDYVVGRGLLSGTSETTFSPDTHMTRGMLVTALGRLEEADVKDYTTNSFTDIKADSAFRPYIEWAYSNGIVQGIGNQQFAPDRAITREEIAVIFQNYAKATDYKLPITHETTAYADADHIGSIYETAVTAMQQSGIMIGGSDNRFNPKSSATRTEVSTMLHRYIKLTINK